jgi:hypothetical protein
MTGRWPVCWRLAGLCWLWLLVTVDIPINTFKAELALASINEPLFFSYLLPARMSIQFRRLKRTLSLTGYFELVSNSNPPQDHTLKRFRRWHMAKTIHYSPENATAMVIENPMLEALCGLT